MRKENEHLLKKNQELLDENKRITKRNQELEKENNQLQYKIDYATNMAAGIPNPTNTIITTNSNNSNNSNKEIPLALPASGSLQKPLTNLNAYNSLHRSQNNIKNLQPPSSPAPLPPGVEKSNQSTPSKGLSVLTTNLSNSSTTRVGSPISTPSPRMSPLVNKRPGNYMSSTTNGSPRSGSKPLVNNSPPGSPLRPLVNPPSHFAPTHGSPLGTPPGSPSRNLFKGSAVNAVTGARNQTSPRQFPVGLSRNPGLRIDIQSPTDKPKQPYFK